MELFIIRLLKLTHQPSRKSQGFTLIELLVTALIGSIIVTGLLFLTNELLTSDRRESTKTETQRDLNLALDFMGAELREAIYVYPNAACLLAATPDAECLDSGSRIITS
ncbi:MAG: prepilin-type N-terminal cleavage/methylation domain-containing protein, partial [Merismopedia sp. SIO2A8]|nr:prepilin-type N-terminal cleavage/methylation domain-containing protein [Merismopedia sp. SIO2A8]